MAKIYKRAFRATLHRKIGGSTETVFVRYFSKVATALSRGLTLSIMEGEPGDVLEVTSSNFDYLIATMRLKVGSKNMATVDIKFHVVDVSETERALKGN